LLRPWTHFKIELSDYSVDLHIHSTFSDGLLTPSEIVRLSIDSKLEVISIADHDSVAGIDESIKAAQNKIEIIPAVELSSNIGKKDIHILGYYIDYQLDELLSYLEEFKEYRIERVKKIVAKLSSDGIKLNFERIKVMAKDGSLGRPHIAEALLQSGYVYSINEAFVRYLGYHCPYYESKKEVKPKEIIQKIIDCKGIPVIAHPGTLGDSSIIYQLIMDGAVGIEVGHPEHTKWQQQQLYELAKKNGLLRTGGSDYHGYRYSRCQIGKCGCKREDVLMLKEYKNKKRNF